MTPSPESAGTSSQLDEWLKQVAAGDERAVVPLYGALFPMVSNFCARSLGEGPDAEDAAQGALIRMFEQAADYDQKTPAVAWALAIAYWQCRTLRTAARRRHDQLGLSAQIDWATSAETPETLLAQREWTTIAHRMLSELSVAERAALSSDSDDLGRALISESPVAKRKRKQRLIRRLREAFGAIVTPRLKS